MLIRREELKEKLKAIMGDEFKIPEGANPFEMALAMMDYLGDTESELRDDLIFLHSIDAQPLRILQSV